MTWHDLAIRFVAYSPFYIMIMVLCIFWYAGKMPHIEQWIRFGDFVSSRGGNILILLLFSLVGLKATMEIFYYALEQVQRGTLQENNAFALMALQFCTTSLFAGSFGAMLKTMNSDSGVSPPKPPNTETTQ